MQIFVASENAIRTWYTNYDSVNTASPISIGNERFDGGEFIGLVARLYEPSVDLSQYTLVDLKVDFTLTMYTDVTKTRVMAVYHMIEEGVPTEALLDALRLYETGQDFIVAVFLVPELFSGSILASADIAVSMELPHSRRRRLNHAVERAGKRQLLQDEDLVSSSITIDVAASPGDQEIACFGLCAPSDNNDALCCEPNVCTCPNGLVDTLDGCLEDGGIKCSSCDDGYILSQDQHCIDFDECQQIPSPCTGDNQVCLNLPGTFACLCDQGYYKEDDECVGIPCDGQGYVGTAGACTCSEYFYGPGPVTYGENSIIGGCEAPSLDDVILPGEQATTCNSWLLFSAALPSARLLDPDTTTVTSLWDLSCAPPFSTPPNDDQTTLWGDSSLRIRPRFIRGRRRLEVYFNNVSAPMSWGHSPRSPARRNAVAWNPETEQEDPDFAGSLGDYAGLQVLDFAKAPTCYEVEGFLNHYWDNFTLYISLVTGIDVEAHQSIWYTEILLFTMF